jgi:hypothetical protein
MPHRDSRRGIWFLAPSRIQLTGVRDELSGADGRCRLRSAAGPSSDGRGRPPATRLNPHTMVGWLVVAPGLLHRPGASTTTINQLCLWADGRMVDETGLRRPTITNIDQEGQPASATSSPPVTPRGSTASTGSPWRSWSPCPVVIGDRSPSRHKRQPLKDIAGLRPQGFRTVVQTTCSSFSRPSRTPTARLPRPASSPMTLVVSPSGNSARTRRTFSGTPAPTPSATA